MLQPARRWAVRALGFLILTCGCSKPSGIDPVQAIRQIGGRAGLNAATGQLEGVDLSGTAATRQDLELVAPLPGLKWLILDNTPLDDDAVRSLEVCGTLERLSLAGTRLTDRGLASIEKCGNVRRLDLSRTAITDAGFEHINRLPHLRILELREAPAVSESVIERWRLGRPGRVVLR